MPNEPEPSTLVTELLTLLMPLNAPMDKLLEALQHPISYPSMPDPELTAIAQKSFKAGLSERLAEAVIIRYAETELAKWKRDRSASLVESAYRYCRMKEAKDGCGR